MKRAKGPGGRALHARVAMSGVARCGWRGRVGVGRYIGDGSEVVSHLREGWNSRKGRGLVLADGETKSEVSLSLGRKVVLAHRDGVDVPDGALRLLDETQRDNQCIDKFFEVILEKAQVH